VGAAPAPAPNTFGKYTLVAKLAVGGMAEIFLARLAGAAGFEKLVCVKRILPHLAKDTNLVGMFLAEAKIAAAISHHNVCQVFELGEIDGRYFIAMEYLEGVPFSCFRRRDMYPPPPDPRLVATLGIQACEGLHHAHQLKRTDGSLLEVVHRDVSSNNLFCTVDGVVKVLDFGIAKVQDASVRTSTGSVKGTYAYMAPEQLRGERLDRRTDVFAMGIVLWEMFARKHLFKRETDFLTFQAITTDPIPDISEFRPDVPPELCAVIAKALSRKPDDRYATTRALGEDLGKSIFDYGGPLTSSELSDVVAEAFEARLADQKKLIKIAREGGVLELDDELGPSVGHGTSMVTTPVSMLSKPGEVSFIPAPPLPRRTSKPMEAVVPQRVSDVFPAYRSSRVLDVPEVPITQVPQLTRSKAPLILFLLLLLGVGGAAFYFFVWASNDKPKQAASGSDVTIVATDGVDAAIGGSYQTRVDAAEVDAGSVAVDAAPVIVDAAPVVVDAAPLPDSGTQVKKPPPVRGPPGHITIDSAPVWATIYIDGKSYGATPLPRLTLSAGTHRVRAVNASGASQFATITIESGKVAQSYRFKW
jgi:eukaryotic-like serine/threonine-protein kinase